MIREIFLEDLSLWSCLWQSTLLAVIGLGGSFFLRRRPARAFQILLLAMVATVVVPAMSVLVKHFGLGAFVAEPVALQPTSTDLSLAMPFEAPATMDGPQANPEGPRTALDAALAEGDSGSIHIPKRAILLLGWLIATLALLGRLLVAFTNGTRLIKRSQPEVREHIQQALDGARARLGIEKNLQIHSSGEIHSPMIWCWSRPALLLVPSNLNDNVDWVGVICHELAHCMRRDHISGLMAELTACTLCWNPLSWFARKRLIRLGEQACDDWVVSGGQPAENYARSLLNFKPQKQAAFVPAVIHNGKGVATRVRRILKDRCSNPRIGTKWVLTTTLTALCLTLGVSFAQTRPTKPTDATAERQDKPIASLHKAAADGDIEQIRSLISNGVDVNSRDIKERTPLHYAASAGRIEVVQLLVEAGADVNCEDKYGETPISLARLEWNRSVVALLVSKGVDISLNLAVFLGDLAKVKRFIENDPDINDRRLHNLLRLSLDSGAAEGVHKEVAEYLLAKGADPDARDRNDATILHSWAWGGDPIETKSVMEFMTRKGADVNALQGEARWTPLHSACYQGRGSVARVLIDCGADVTAKDRRDWTPLHYAADMGMKDVAELLIAKGADVNAVNRSGLTPLRLAIQEGHRDVARLLIGKDADIPNIPRFQRAVCVDDLARVKEFVEKGTNIDAKDERGWTALHWVALVGHKDVAEYLIAKGAEVNAKANDSSIPLHRAARAGNTDIAALLLKKGANVNAPDKDGATPLYRAAQAGRAAVVALLVDKGADVNARDKASWTPLHAAARRGHGDVVGVLIAKGAAVNAQLDINNANWGGWTALHCAVNYYAPPSVSQVLVTNGADVNARDRWVRTPLHTAALLKYRTDVAEILIAGGADINATDENGHTPLSLADQQGLGRNVELFRRHGAKE